MAFSKKPKKEAAKPWLCGCKLTLPAYILFCGKCGKGQSTKPKETS
jgi:hypothetical protein